MLSLLLTKLCTCVSVLAMFKVCHRALKFCENLEATAVNVPGKGREGERFGSETCDYLNLKVAAVIICIR